MTTPKYEFVPAELKHLVELAHNMREADKAEVGALGLAPLEALLQSAKVSRDTKAALADGKVVAVFGCGRAGELSTTGIAWILTSNLVRKHKKAFLRYTKQVVQEWLTEYTCLTNVVDKRYVEAHRWLEWLGFRNIGETSIRLRPFICYELRA